MGGQSGCERRIEVFVKKKIFGGGRGGVGGSVGGSGWGWGGVRVDVNEIEVFCENSKKKKFGGGGSGGVGWGGGSGLGWGVRLDVNEELKFL